MKKFILSLCVAAAAMQGAYAGEITRLTKDNLNLLPKGKEVDGMIGDWVIKNDKVVAVIGNTVPDREANQMVSSIQGAVIDFTRLTDNNDQLVVFYPQGSRVDIPSADTAIVLRGSGSMVQLKVIRYATADEPFRVETLYSLEDGAGGLAVITTYTNTSATPIRITPYDVLRCDNALEDVTPSGTGNLAYIYNKWYNAAYGVLSPSHSFYTPPVQGKRNFLTQGQRLFYEGNTGKPEESSIGLPPGATYAVSRTLMTGKDVADLQGQAKLNANLRAVKIIVKDANGRQLDQQFVMAHNERSELLSAVRTTADGTGTLYLPEGPVRLSVTGPGHDTVSGSYTVVTDNNPQTFTLKPETSISFSVADENGEFLPVKVSFTGINGTRRVNLGPGTRANGVMNLYYANSKDFTVPIPEGDYQVVVSHGPEYNAEVMTVKAVLGKDTKVSVKVHRAYSSLHYVLADIHNHSTRSGDSNAGVDDRVINMAAAGVEFSPATEHNRISTYEGEIKELHLEQFIKSAVGIELSGRPGPGETNHQNAFPLRMQPGLRGNGAPKTDKDPYVQMGRLYAYDNNAFKFMQQNHPDISHLYFDKNKDGVTDSGYGTAKFTDAMEIRETMFELPEALSGGETNTRSFQWLQMLNLGYRIFGTANTDAHVVGNGTGSLYNYVFSQHDQPAEIDPMEMAHALKDGHSIMTNGPFMTVGVNNVLPGSSVKAPGGKVKVHVKILTANWDKVNTIWVIVNGRADSTLKFSFPSTNSVEKDIPVALKGDAHIIVLAFGQNESVGIVDGDKDIRPMALSNPVFVDTDGNGFTPNKDLLGQPLPAKKSRKAASEE